MYSSEIIEITKSCYDKSAMLSMSVNKPNRQMILQETSWLPETTNLKSRCVIIQNGFTQDTFPSCKKCGNHVKYNCNDDGTFNQYCSDKCRKTRKTILCADTYEKLASYDWLYKNRIELEKSFENLADELNCSVIPIKKACRDLKLPHVRHNESNSLTTSFLKNKEWLFEQHVVKQRKYDDICAEIGSHKATLSRWMIFHGIEANNPNIYERSHVTASKEENEVVEYINSLGVEIQQGNRTILNGSEIDIFIPAHNIGIEYNGIYSHVFRPEESAFARRKDRYYHLNKTNAAKEKGVDLIHIFSDDWTFRKDICKSILSAKLGFNKKIYARQCEIVSLTSYEKKIFLNQNHIQGSDKSKMAIGLKHDGILVAVMSFCKSRYNKKISWELNRFASLKFHTIVGGFSRLLKFFRNGNSGSIISYADRSRSNGDVYLKNGFGLSHINPPSYHYVNFNKSIQRMHRSNFNKSKIRGGPDDKRTEFEIMTDLNYHKIFDCGTMAFIIN